MKLINWGNLGKRVAGTFSGFNYYKWGAVAALLLAWTTAVHMRATNKCETAQLEKEKAAVVQEAADAFKHVRSRVSVIQTQEQKAAEIRYITREIKGNLDEAINQKPDLPSCDLSSNELRYWQELAKTTER